MFVAFQITPLPGAWPQKPGSATFPFFGVQVFASLDSSSISSLVFIFLILLLSIFLFGVNAACYSG